MAHESPAQEQERPARRVTIKVTEDVLERVDAWRAQQEDKPSRGVAIQRLLVAHFWPNL